MRTAFALSAVLVLAFMPAVVLAAPNWLPLVQCGRAVAAGQQPVPCTPCDIFAMGERLINMILYGITGPIAAFMIVIAGGMMLLGGASPNQFAQGKKLLRNTLIGVAIILLAWTFTNFLIKSLGNGSPTDSWNQFSCPAELIAISKIDTQFPTPGPIPAIPPVTAPLPANIGVPSAETRQDLCATSVGGKTYKCSSCQNITYDGEHTLGDYTHYYGGGYASLLDSIMFAESSCKPSADGGAGAYGLMQLKPETARKFQKDCDVYKRNTDGTYVYKDGQKVPIPITAGFLMSESNAEFIVCLAAKYVNSLIGPCGTSPRNIAAAYNAGPGYCGLSIDCPTTQSCAGGPMQKWECPWDDRAHLVPNTGLLETRGYAPKVSYCATKL